jgi:hypothetical protein
MQLQKLYVNAIAKTLNINNEGTPIYIFKILALVFVNISIAVNELTFLYLEFNISFCD